MLLMLTNAPSFTTLGLAAAGLGSHPLVTSR
jgi:hypothetical protein